MDLMHFTTTAYFLRSLALSSIAGRLRSHSAYIQIPVSALSSGLLSGAGGLLEFVSVSEVALFSNGHVYSCVL